MNESSVRKHFDRIALAYDRGKGRYSFYYSRLKRILKSLIPPSRNVFEVGCGTGDLLNCLRPARGYGFDISEKMVSIAKSKYEKSEKLKFSGKWPKEKFEYIFMSDVVEHLENPEEVFKKISRLMQPETVFVNTMANPVWEPILILGEKLRLKMPEGPHKRIEYQKVKLMMEKAGMKIIQHDCELLIPIKISFITDFANRYLERYLKKYAFIEYLVAKKE